MSLESFNRMKQKQGAYLADLGDKLAEMDYQAMVDAAEEKAEARGVAKVAVQMLQEGYAISSISKVTGLSKTKVSRLKNGK